MNEDDKPEEIVKKETKELEAKKDSKKVEATEVKQA
jgi:hypothetical protein